MRELEAALKAAYMNKERSAQLAEKEAQKIDEMVNILIINEISLLIVCFIIEERYYESIFISKSLLTPNIYYTNFYFALIE